MTWSTRELANLAGTTVNTVRHYHALGLLEEPDRRMNGYKQYRVAHLVSLIRMRRMVELGIPLSRISQVDASGPDALRDLDEDLRAGIDRLTRARADVAALASAQAPLDTPRGFEQVYADLPPADRSFLQVCARLADATVLADVVTMLEREPVDLRTRFTALPEDADRTTRRRLADDVMRSGTNWRAVVGVGSVGRALEESRRELYNAAQRDVLGAASVATPQAS